MNASSERAHSNEAFGKLRQERAVEERGSMMRDQGRAHLRQRGPRSWELKFDLGRDASGKRISRHVTFRGTKREAQAELNRLLNRRNGGPTSIRPR